MHRLTYAKAGVDIDRTSKAVETLIETLRFIPKRAGIGKQIEIKNHFVGCVKFFKQYAIAMCTDGVGTKLIVAEKMRRWNTVGIDCVAMNVNDMICIGATPIAFVDYLAVPKPDKRIMHQIGIGLQKGARIANIAVVGGETAVLPEVVNHIDLSGTCIGYVKTNEMITGDKIKIGDLIVSLRSSGIHSNGLTLARKIVEKYGYSYDDFIPGSRQTIGQALLKPTRIYVNVILKMLKKFHNSIHGLANITGGGIRNLTRLKSNVRFEITAPPKAHKIFEFLQKTGGIDTKEMYQTFNMGMGFCIVYDQKVSKKLMNFLKTHTECKIIGTVKEGSGVAVHLKDEVIEYYS
jgi:phosphoribosylformylglycinamidine cyclo-ligase